MKERKGAFGAAQPGKLVFVRTSAAQYLPPGGQCHQLKEPGPVFPVIASQCAHWRGNPFPLQRHDFLHVTKEKTDCHVAALLAMTVVNGTLALKLMTLPRGEGGPRSGG